jgi:hypothetical protein
MLQYLRYHTPRDAAWARKLRLFACAGARRAAGVDDAGRAAIAVAERLADRRADPAEVQAARQSGVRGPARKTLHRSPRFAATDVAYAHDADPLLPALLRDVFGNPFRPTAHDPALLRWKFDTIPAIARHVYDDRAYHDLPILADALEEAGCTDGDILAHCRSEGPHVRGCWAVDFILSKS